MNILFAFQISMCDKSRNTWLCVHWQWNTLEWCPLNALQASPVVHLVTPLSCVSLSMNIQPSVPAIYVQHRHIKVQCQTGVRWWILISDIYGICVLYSGRDIPMLWWNLATFSSRSILTEGWLDETGCRKIVEVIRQEVGCGRKATAINVDIYIDRWNVFYHLDITMWHILWAS